VKSRCTFEGWFHPLKPFLDRNRKFLNSSITPLMCMQSSIKIRIFGFAMFPCEHHRTRSRHRGPFSRSVPFRHPGTHVRWRGCSSPRGYCYDTSVSRMKRRNILLSITKSDPIRSRAFDPILSDS